MKNKNWFLYLIIILLVVYIGYTDFYKNNETDFMSESFQKFTSQDSNTLLSKSNEINPVISDFSLILDNQDYYINKTVILQGKASNFAQFGFIYDSNGENIKIDLKRSRKFDKEKTIKIEGIILPTFNSMPKIIKDENGKLIPKYERDGIYLNETNILKN